MELNSKDKSKKVIAFYLPQFHTIPENDLWWGKGFTEWTNTRKAKPLFEGHEQPKTPLNGNYYDLSDVTVMEEQAKLAKTYGLFGFCYYHYWFKGGKKLLEKPVEQMLKEPKVDIPFCICWANENWTRNWDGGNREIIAEQDYGSPKDWEEHFNYLLEFFNDPRYILWNNNPILIVYKPEQIPCFNKMIKLFNDLAVKNGFSGIKIAAQFPSAYYFGKDMGLNIDWYIKFEPVMSLNVRKEDEINRIKGNVKYKIKAKIKKYLQSIMMFQNILKIKKKTNIPKKKKELEINDYDEVWDIIINKESYSKEMISGGFVSWDNTARNKNGMLVKGSTPDKFEKYMTELVKKPSAMNLVFVNAWNEWAEGAYLEPDERYGYAYLEALKKAVDSQ